MEVANGPNLLARLVLHNTLILIPDSDASNEDPQPSSSNVSQAEPSALPCRALLASTAWKQTRDTFLLAALHKLAPLKHVICPGRKDQRRFHALLLVGSLVEVGLTVAWLRRSLASEAWKVYGISGLEDDMLAQDEELNGSRKWRMPSSNALDIIELKKKLGEFESLVASESVANGSVLVLSAPVALMALSHGFMKLLHFDLLTFMDLEGANQLHPFCVLMDYFYTLGPRVLCFGKLPSVSSVCANIFASRDWLKRLQHYAITFHSSVVSMQAIGEGVAAFEPVPLEDDPIRAVEASIAAMASPWEKSNPLRGARWIRVDSRKEAFQEMNRHFPKETLIVLTDCHDAEECPLPHRVVQFGKQIDSEGASAVLLLIDIAVLNQQLLMDALKTLDSLPASSNTLTCYYTGPEIVSRFLSMSLIHQLGKHLHISPLDETRFAAAREAARALNMFTLREARSKRYRLLGLRSARHWRIEETGALLVPMNAVSILVRACVLLAREHRQGNNAETIRFETVKVMSVDGLGNAISNTSIVEEEEDFETEAATAAFSHTHNSNFSFLAQLFLPPVMAKKIGLRPEESLQGPLKLSRRAAQFAVAFEAACRLREAGVLDEYWMLSEHFRQSHITALEQMPSANAQIAAGPDSVELSFAEIVPRALTNSFDWSSLYLYAVEYELVDSATLTAPKALPVTMTPLTRLLENSLSDTSAFTSVGGHRMWGLALPSELPIGLVPVEIPIGPAHCFKATLRRVGQNRIQLSSEQAQHLMQAQHALFTIFSVKPMAIPSANEAVPEPDDSRVPETHRPKYLIVPLKRSSEEQPNDWVDADSLPQVWELWTKFVESVRAAPLAGAVIQPVHRSEPETVSWEVEWSLVEKLSLERQFEYQKDSLLAYLDALDAFCERVDVSATIQLEEGGKAVDFKSFALQRLVLQVPHTQIAHRIKKMLPHGMTPARMPFTHDAFPKVRSIADYTEQRYGLKLERADAQKLVDVQRVESWNDLALWISEDGSSKWRRKSSARKKRPRFSAPDGDDPDVCADAIEGTEETAPLPMVSASWSETNCILIPELTVVFPMAYVHVRRLMLLPRIAHDIERQLRIAQFFADQMPRDMPLPRHELAVVALTSSSACLSYDYEQFEVLGDCVLKLVTTTDVVLTAAESRTAWSEGKLSATRQARTCNGSLKRCAERLCLQAYASLAPFQSRTWTAPALGELIWETASPELRARALPRRVIQTVFGGEERWRLRAAQDARKERHAALYVMRPDGTLQRGEAEGAVNGVHCGQPIQAKVCADLLESLIAAFYIEHGYKGATGFLHWLGLLSERPMVGLGKIDPLSIVAGAAGQAQGPGQDKMFRRPNPTVVERVLIGQSGGEAPIKQSSEPAVSAQLPETKDFPYTEIERVLGYTFRERRLLFLAISHASVEPSRCQERLEWLGDAALDMFVTRHYWYKYRIDDEQDPKETAIRREDREGTESRLSLGERPLDTGRPLIMPEEVAATPLDSAECIAYPFVGRLVLDPEAITCARQNAVSNVAFSRLAVYWGLYRFLRIDSETLQLEIARYAESVEQDMKTGKSTDDENEKLGKLSVPSAESGQATGIGTGTVVDPEQLPVRVLQTSPPKALGDLFEAIAGAVLVDCSFRWSVFARVFDPLFTWYIDRFACPFDDPANPIQNCLQAFARLGIPRHQLSCVFRDILGADKTVAGAVCQIRVRGRCVSEAEAANRNVARKLAMQQAVDRLVQGAWMDFV